MSWRLEASEHNFRGEGEKKSNLFGKVWSIVVRIPTLSEEMAHARVLKNSSRVNVSSNLVNGELLACITEVCGEYSPA